MAKKFLQKPIMASGLGDFVTTVDSGTVTEAMQVLADNTTNNVSTTKHGYVPKAPNLTTQFLRGDGSWASPTATVANAWDGAINGCWGDGNPHTPFDGATMDGSVAATPTNIAITVARISYFRLPANITVNKIRFFGVGATTNIYRCAIYNGDTLNRLTAELPFTTAAATWGSAGTGLALTLTAGQLYFIAVSVNAVGTTAGCMCMSPTVAATTGLIGVLPKSWPGNLGIDLGYIKNGMAQFAVTTGALPATVPTIAAQAAWTGGFPAFWLDNNNA
jgi:hypothetical protein